METYNGLPWFRAVKTEPNNSHPGSEIFYIYCDQCNKHHTHGAPGGKSDKNNLVPTHRVAHCASDKSAYYKKGYYVSY